MVFAFGLVAVGHVALHLIHLALRVFDGLAQFGFLLAEQVLLLFQFLAHLCGQLLGEPNVFTCKTVALEHVLPRVFLALQLGLQLVLHLQLLIVARLHLLMGSMGLLQGVLCGAQQ